MAQGDTITEMIQDLYATREQIIDSIRNKGVDVADNTKYEEFPLLIDEIDSESSLRELWGTDRSTATTVYVPPSTTKIGDYSFYGCKSLESLRIPSSVTTIGKNAFSTCPSSCNIRIEKTMADVSSIMNRPWGISVGAIIHCSDGDLKVTSSTSVGPVSQTPVLTRVFDITTAQDGVITSENSFFVFGSNLTWDDTKDDEGFFIEVDDASEHKCYMTESVQDPSCAALRNPLVFEEAGRPVTLVFRTRSGGSTLKQYEFSGSIVSAVYP